MVFAKDGGIWQGQLHIYQMPFYYIDYTLAQTCAFQFWIKNEVDKKNSGRKTKNITGSNSGSSCSSSFSTCSVKYEKTRRNKNQPTVFS